MGMDCLVSPMQSVLLIALMLDCGGRQELEKGRKGAGEKEGDGERETERERERERVLQECVPRESILGWGRASGMLPRRVPVKARAGLEECSSRGLRVEAGWGRARRMFPQSTPLTLGQE